LNDKKIRSATKRAVAYGKARGLSEEQSEDLAQRWVIKVFVERTGQRLEQAYVDFLRSEFGDTRTACGARKSADRLSNKGVSGNDSRREPVDGGHNRLCDGQSDERHRKLILLSARERAFISAIENGMTQNQIADWFNVTPSRISQIIAAITKKMQIANLEKSLEVQWIKL